MDIYIYIRRVALLLCVLAVRSLLRVQMWVYIYIEGLFALELNLDVLASCLRLSRSELVQGFFKERNSISLPTEKAIYDCSLW